MRMAACGLGQIEEVADSLDDSDGEFASELHRLLHLHAQACEIAKPDPAEMAEWLFEATMGSPFDTFDDALSLYAKTLGKAGRAAFLRMAKAEWAKGVPTGPGEATDAGVAHHRIAAIMEDLARESGDLEALVTVKSRDLSSSYRFLVIAELYREAGNVERTIHWAQRGLNAFRDSPHEDGLRRVLAEAYQDAGRSDDALILAWEGFSDASDINSYLFLKSHAERAGCWTERREAALARIRKRIGRRAKAKSGSWPPPDDASLLVAILLHEGDTDAAWREATAGGCSEGLWLEMAKLREKSHPADAVRIYRDQGIRSAAGGGEQAYRTALGYLETIHRALSGRSDDFAAVVAEIRARHGRKRNLMAMLDQKGW